MGQGEASRQDSEPEEKPSPKQKHDHKSQTEAVKSGGDTAGICRTQSSSRPGTAMKEKYPLSRCIPSERRVVVDEIRKVATGISLGAGTYQGWDPLGEFVVPKPERSAGSPQATLIQALEAFSLASSAKNVLPVYPFPGYGPGMDTLKV
ncbi:hypothetical protein llap_12191 [Limosa lapponica baueri]|uniref:Uncharacterized protein n=1 Tax=Limosa lapponica baueri TaxID=1758121 RepID=A0A2I0TUP6_LIMLA|nr:hypothetical protein llap_12191 [Limosa lapponica baueri]